MKQFVAVQTISEFPNTTVRTADGEYGCSTPTDREIPRPFLLLSRRSNTTKPRVLCFFFCLENQKTYTTRGNCFYPTSCLPESVSGNVMLGVLRKVAMNASHRVDRSRMEGHLLRSLRYEAQLHLSTRHYSHNGFHGLAVQRALEGIAGSAKSNDENNRTTAEARYSLHCAQKFSPPRSCEPRTNTFPRSFSTATDTTRLTQVFNSLSPSVETPQPPLPSPYSLPVSRGSHTNSPPQRMRLGDSRRYLSTDTNSQYKTSAKIPTPKSAPNHSMFSLASFDPKSLVKGLLDTTWNITKIVLKFLVQLPMNAYFYSTHPKERREKIQELKGHAKKEFDHYWTGSKVKTKTLASYIPWIVPFNSSHLLPLSL